MLEFDAKMRVLAVLAVHEIINPTREKINEELAGVEQTRIAAKAAISSAQAQIAGRRVHE